MRFPDLKSREAYAIILNICKTDERAEEQMLKKWYAKLLVLLAVVCAVAAAHPAAQAEAIPEETLLQVFGPKLFEAVRDENRQDCLANVMPEALRKAWPEMRTIIGDIPPAEEIFRMLELLGAKRTLPDIGVPEDRLAVLLRWSPIIRNRLTLIRMRRVLDFGE